MSKKWLILDCNFLCHRLKYTMGSLEHGGTPTGVAYGFLKSIPVFQKQFNTPHIIFCWDSKTSKRRKIYYKYKQHRQDKYRDMEPKEIAFEKAFRKQMYMLRKHYLPTIGYANVFVQRGCEGDDIIAAICHTMKMADEAIIISSDHDLYQLINSQVSFYNPIKGKILTAERFRNSYGVEPFAWAQVKAIAGCSGDGVPGIKGVGELTALKYLRRELKTTSKAYQRINSTSGIAKIRRNNKLVLLPLEGTQTPVLGEDDISSKGWNKVVRYLGMDSLKDKPPYFKRKRKRKLI
jgi:5'-3' exonuclease